MNHCFEYNYRNEVYREFLLSFHILWTPHVSLKSFVFFQPPVELTVHPKSQLDWQVKELFFPYQNNVLTKCAVKWHTSIILSQLRNKYPSKLG